MELEPLISGTRNKHNLFAGLGSIFSMEFLPRGFLQMIYLDTSGFDRHPLRQARRGVAISSLAAALVE